MYVENVKFCSFKVQNITFSTHIPKSPYYITAQKYFTDLGPISQQHLSVKIILTGRESVQSDARSTI